MRRKRPYRCFDTVVYLYSFIIFTSYCIDFYEKHIYNEYNFSENKFIKNEREGKILKIIRGRVKLCLLEEKKN